MTVRAVLIRTVRPTWIAAALAGWALLPSANALDAQLIPIRTVPVASGDQFRLVPSTTLGMGGVRYAVDDSLADGWSNPARGGIRGPALFMASPTFYGISNNGGGGRSFPVTGLFGGSSWFGGASLALQQVENTPTDRGWGWFWGGPQNTLSERFGRNIFASGFVGRRFGDGKWSIGVGASAARLAAMDGVDLLYAGAESIDQSGDVNDLRVAVERRGDRDRVAAILVHNRVSMVHDVTYNEWVWDDTLQTGEWVRREEKNEDRTRTWAGQLLWDRRLDAPGWHIGAGLSVNRKSHPKIPNYSIQNIPRDPGDTWAFEAGFGVSRTEGRTTFALDVALQPIWSETWQVADSTDAAGSEGRLSVGDRSIENDFEFTNLSLRSGIEHAVSWARFQAGLEILSYGYTLDQRNNVEDTRREQDEDWVEWTPTFGVAASLGSLDLRYGLRFTHGTGRPGVAGLDGVTAEALQAGDFILAPGAPLTLVDARVVTHQIAVVIPVR